MPAIVELTPLTQRGQRVLSQLERRTGLSAIGTSEASGAKTYHLAGSANVDGFQAALDRIEPSWDVHLTFRVLTQTE